MTKATTVAEEMTFTLPKSSAAAKRLYQYSWFATSKDYFKLETDLQKCMLCLWNQMAASAKNID